VGYGAKPRLEVADLAYGNELSGATKTMNREPKKAEFVKRHIAHIDILDFCATLEELRQPELKRRPLVLAEPGPRAITQGVNRVARLEGIREGMPLGQAQRFCRRLLVMPPDGRYYQHQHQHIIEVLGQFSPLVEGTTPGHYFVDLTGTRRLWGPCPDAASRMNRQLAAKKGLEARVGLASNKLISQIAAHYLTPGDLGCIFSGGETAFLNPLPVIALPGVGSKTSSRLLDFNIETIGQLAAIPAGTLCSVFGRMGSRLLQLAQGLDATPVLPFRKVPRLCVARTLERDEIDRERLEAILFRQVEEAGWMLRCHNRYPGQFALEIRYADGVTVRNQHLLPPITTQVDQRLFRVARSAFDRLVRRRIAIRRMVLELSDFTMPVRQLSLFPWEEATLLHDQKIQRAIDTIRHRFGRRAVSWGKAVAGIEGLRD
jgi:DNA polymerase IV